MESKRKQYNDSSQFSGEREANFSLPILCFNLKKSGMIDRFKGLRCNHNNLKEDSMANKPAVPLGASSRRPEE